MGLLLCGCSEDSRILFREYQIADGTLSISYDEPPAFGPHTLHFEYQIKGSEDLLSLGSAQLNNDGANLTDENVQVEVVGEGMARVTLRGQQQKEKILLLKVDGDEVSLSHL